MLVQSEILGALLDWRCRRDQGSALESGPPGKDSRPRELNDDSLDPDLAWRSVLASLGGQAFLLSREKRRAAIAAARGRSKHRQVLSSRSSLIDLKNAWSTQFQLGVPSQMPRLAPKSAARYLSQIILDVANGMLCQVFVNLGNDERLYVRMKCAPQIGQRPRRSHDHDSGNPVRTNQPLHRRRDLAHKAMLFDMMPIYRLDRAALS